MGSRLSRLSADDAISSDEPVHIYLDQKTDLQHLTNILADSGLVSDEKEMLWAGRLLGWNQVRKGHYLVDGPFSYDSLLSQMARGIQDPINVTILPGLTEARLMKSVVTQFSFDSTSLAQTLSDSSFLASHGLREHNWIGRMLPDTYSLYWTSTPRKVVERILKEFERSVEEQYSQRLAELDRGLGDIVILASIIEWEVRYEEEKARVSGLYWNRLKKGMRLQADPTVNYAVGERRRLLYEDYRTEHPYNTYLNRGLPPGPITNPSLSSIKAALFPEDHDYLYMVASPRGYHLFSETFEEHKEKSEKWRRWLRQQYRIKRQREQETQEQAGDAR